MSLCDLAMQTRGGGRLTIDLCAQDLHRQTLSVLQDRDDRSQGSRYRPEATISRNFYMQRAIVKGRAGWRKVD